MAETGHVRFPGSLDPGAQEFIPRNPNQLTLFGPPPPQPLPPPPHQVFYPYPPISEVVPYAQYAASPAYASAAPTVCTPVPPPSVAATRAVLLSSVPSDVSEGTVRREVEGFGEVRWVQMERVCEGIVTVHFYDLRHAERALREFREQNMQQQQVRLRNNYASYTFIPNTPPPLPPNNLSSQLLPVTPGRGLIAGQPVWAQFVIPALKAVPDGHNQGTIVIFNLDSAVTTSTLKDTFQAFGPVKELRETPSKKHQRFIEFFDVRDAAKALKEMNGKEINGKPVVIEFSRPGGHSRKYLNAVGNTTRTLVSPTNIIAPLHSNNALVSYPPSPSRELVGKFSRRPNSLNMAPPPPHLYASLSPQIQFPSSRNKSTNICSSKGNVGANGSLRRSNSSSVEAQMGGLNLGGAVEESHLVPGQPIRSCSSSKKSCQNSQNQVVMSPPRPQQAKSSRGRKGRQGKKMDSKFLIKEEAMAESSSADTRTTVMIKNIPNKYRSYY
ncbi:PREDICTED: MEI2 [Prunus dulcis]|uniref:PREDICTED: MEI2 n=1 Tax=Prunus dulcis TaxID=3755 RepID=A0A5E4EE90_PRUDU|nr:PREDICTED: MEI2 [Prunus dulcis]